MGNNARPEHEASIRPRLRIMRKAEIALGPGRVDLLELIAITGSLRAAAKRMGISYMRAWNLVQFTNRCFSKPLVQTVRGGETGGGAMVTDLGRLVIALYRQMEVKSQSAIKQPWAKLKKMLK